MIIEPLALVILLAIAWCAGAASAHFKAAASLSQLQRTLKEKS